MIGGWSNHRSAAGPPDPTHLTDGLPAGQLGRRQHLLRAQGRRGCCRGGRGGCGLPSPHRHGRDGGGRGAQGPVVCIVVRGWVSGSSRAHINDADALYVSKLTAWPLGSAPGAAPPPRRPPPPPALPHRWKRQGTVYKCGSIGEGGERSGSPPSWVLAPPSRISSPFRTSDGGGGVQPR